MQIKSFYNPEKKLIFTFIVANFANFLFFICGNSQENFLFFELLILFVTAIIVVFKKECEEFKIVYSHIEKNITSRFPLLKLEPFFFIAFGILGILMMLNNMMLNNNKSSEVTAFLCCTRVMICYYFCLFLCYKVYCGYEDFITFSKKQKLPAFSRGNTKFSGGNLITVRNFGGFGGRIFGSYALFIGKPILMGGARFLVVSGAAGAIDTFATKMIFGPDERSLSQNLLSYGFRGVVTDSDLELWGYNKLTRNYGVPSKLLLKGDNATIDPKKLLIYSYKKGVPDLYDVGTVIFDDAMKGTYRKWKKKATILLFGIPKDEDSDEE